MAIQQVPYTGKAFKIGAVVCGGVVLSGAENSEVLSGITKEMIKADGALAPRGSYIKSIQPSIKFTTRNLDILVATGMRGKALNKIGSGPNRKLEVYVELLEPNASIMGGAKHLKWEADSGILAPTSIKVASEGVATVDYELKIASPPQTWPLEVIDNVSLPALTDMKLYGLGPMFMNGLFINTKTNVDIQIGTKLEPFARDGNIYPECFYAIGYEPKINVTVNDLSLVTTLGRSGSVSKTGGSGGGMGTCLFLRRRVDGGEYYPNNEQEHIKLTFGGDYIFEKLGGGGSEELATIPLVIDVLQKGSASDQEIDVTAEVEIPVEIDPASYA